MFGEQISQTFNLGLEVLTGCNYHCLGCTVAKDMAPFDIPESDTTQILTLLDDLIANDFRLLELKIGPTDITTSNNGVSVLSHPAIKQIADRYKSITINMSMLSDDGLPEIAGLLDNLAPGKYVNVGIPLTLKNVCNVKFMNSLKKRLAYFKGLMKKAVFTRVYPTINIEENNLFQFNDRAYSKLMNMDFGSGLSKVVEFPFVRIREGFDNLLVAEQVKRDISVFSLFMKTKALSRDYIHLVPGHNEGYEFTYRSGKLYSTILLVENITLFSEEFELPKPWTAEQVLDNRFEAYQNNLMVYSEHPECGDCCFLDNCARGGVQQLMDAVGSSTCLTGMKNRWDIQRLGV